MLRFLRDELCAIITDVMADQTYTQEAVSERLANAGWLPMFGFPTRVRSLFTFWPKYARNWPPESGTVERNLDQAISMFAPGSETVKDKAVYTAAGVVDFLPAGAIVRTRDGFAPALNAGTGANPICYGLCEHCQAVTGPHVLSQPAAGGQEPQRQACPVCGQPNGIRLLDTREPQGFFTDLQPDDFEGQFEWQPRSTRPSISIKDTEQAMSNSVGNALVHAVREPIISMNDDGGRGGFDFRAVKVQQQPRLGAYAALGEDDTNGPVVPYGKSWRIALLSRRVTDALLMDVRTWPQGVFANPTTIEGRAAWYSFAFWLRVAAGVQLDVDLLELQAGFRTRPGAGRPAGQAFLTDVLENGAGYCRHLALPEQFEELLTQGGPDRAKSIAAQWMEAKIGDGRFGPHALECDTSCNRCLRDFHNLPYHGLLDWRLALDMARLAGSANVVADLSSPWGKHPNPWTRLTEGPLPAMCDKLNYGPATPFGSLMGYVHKSPARRQIAIVRHPLWEDDHPEWQAAHAAAVAQHPGCTILATNPFLALRRPGDLV